MLILNSLRENLHKDAIIHLKVIKLKSQNGISADKKTTTKNCSFQIQWQLYMLQLKTLKFWFVLT